jgi:hypothetical protein
MARSYSRSKLLLGESERGPMLDDESGQILELSKPALLGSVRGAVAGPSSASLACGASDGTGVRHPLTS